MIFFVDKKIHLQLRGKIPFTDDLIDLRFFSEERFPIWAAIGPDRSDNKGLYGQTTILAGDQEGKN